MNKLTPYKRYALKAEDDSWFYLEHYDSVFLEEHEKYRVFKGGAEYDLIAVGNTHTEEFDVYGSKCVDDVIYSNCVVSQLKKFDELDGDDTVVYSGAIGDLENLLGKMLIINPHGKRILANYYLVPPISEIIELE